MVILYTGTPGSGKSYHATQIVHRATKRKTYVIANFVINLPEKQQPYFFYLGDKQFTVDNLIKFNKEYLKENKESQAIIIIDEAGTMFNSTTRKANFIEKWLKFFSLHRKLGYDVILIAQNDRMIDRQIRGNIEYHYVHRKLSNFGFKGFIIKFLLHKDFVCVHQWYTIKERLGAEYFRICKRIAQSYDTFSLFDYSEKSNSLSGYVSAAEFNRNGGAERE